MVTVSYAVSAEPPKIQPIQVRKVVPQRVRLTADKFSFYANKPYLKTSDGDCRVDPTTARVSFVTEFDKQANRARRQPISEVILAAAKPYFAQGFSAADTSKNFLRPGSNRPIRGFSNRSLDDVWAVFNRAEEMQYAEPDDPDTQPSAALVVEF